MPSRYSSRCGLVDGLLSISPNTLQSNMERNIFDKAFKDEMHVAQWDGYMQWEGDSELVPAQIDRQMSQSGSISAPELWSVDTVPSLSATIPSIYKTHYSFDDAPFEFDNGILGVQALGPAHSASFFSKTSHQSFQWPLRGASPLTDTEERALRDIAMPRHALSKYKVDHMSESPTLSPMPSPALPSPRQETRTRKRQKPLGDDEVSTTTLCQSRRRGHNAIEKRYRTNLNEKIVCLRDAIPSLGRNSGSSEKSGDECEDSDAEPAAKQGHQKYGKADVLVRALDYIKHLETTTGRLGSEVEALNARVEAFEQLPMNGIMISNGNSGVGFDRKQLTRTETLESIQEDFKQISTKERAEQQLGQAPRRKSSRRFKGY